MPAPLQRWTRARVLALPDDGRRHELVDGEHLVTPAPGWPHQRAVAALFRRLDPWVRAMRLGEVTLSPADLALEPDEILQPDLFVVPRELAGGTDWARITRLLLAVEVTSPSTHDTDRTRKRRRYQRAGVPEYWVVDPDARQVERWRPGDEEPEVLAATLAWQPRAGEPLLELDLVELFEEVWGVSR